MLGFLMQAGRLGASTVAPSRGEVGNCLRRGFDQLRQQNGAAPRASTNCSHSELGAASPWSPSADLEP